MSGTEEDPPFSHPSIDDGAGAAKAGRYIPLNDRLIEIMPENDLETGTIQQAGIGIPSHQRESVTGIEPHRKSPPPPPPTPDEDIEDGPNVAPKDRRSASSKSTTSQQTSASVSNKNLAAIVQAMGWHSQRVRYFGKVIVLLDLKLLNQSRHDVEDAHSSQSSRPPTKIPVNQFGFPPGHGRSEDERSGPYRYVACAINRIRRNSALSSSREFDTSSFGNSNIGSVVIERCDTQAVQTIPTDQKMRILDDSLAIRAAIAAAHDGFDADLEVVLSPPSEAASEPWFKKLQKFFESRVFAGVKRFIGAIKTLLTELLRGEPPFSCKVRITTINLLVICSTIFLFLPYYQLGFLSPEYDDDVAIFGLIIWCILVLELIFEIMIRPSGYNQLLRSEKAYRPSTALYISPMYVVGEALALILYIPEIICLKYTTEVCLIDGSAGTLRLVGASAKALLGPTLVDVLLGRLVVGLVALRLFGVVRHWKRMIIRQTFNPIERQGIEKWVIPYDPELRKQREKKRLLEKKKDHDETTDNYLDDIDLDSSDSKENQRLKSAANIGTALIVVNCQRALILIILCFTVIPLIYINDRNLSSHNLTKMLEAQNLISATDCEYLELAIDSWLNMAIVNQGFSYIDTPYVLWAQVLPVRCPFQDETGVITSCTGKQSRFRDNDFTETCDIWDQADPPNFIEGYDSAIRNYFASIANLRGDTIFAYQRPTVVDSSQFETSNDFQVTVVFNHKYSVAVFNTFHLYMLVAVFFLGLGFLVLLQNDVYNLALHPIQRMLRIVVRYAENPLADDVEKKGKKMALRGTTDDIGDIETEQLLNAITKISDLLRKCWGVAGAGIISSNLGREKNGRVAVFNPTVPGKQVYALFGFVSIGGYSELLKKLDRDVMIIINDIASVVHDEIYRWALGDFGQCNKNLGPAFLMVWRIGDFNEVQQKNNAAIEKIFRDKVYRPSSKNHPNLRRRLGSSKSSYSSFTTTTTKRSTISSSMGGKITNGRPEIQLESLPGIQEFADRALLGMLKSFAGIHRDRNLQEWKNDFRLRPGGFAATSSYTVDVAYGMDAGWAVEGAVGSEYKIDATYLSPHVNMASRMMSASKQYGSTILLSKAVEKLLSKPCRTKLRHLDTVYVKGSAIKQAIYTYDARHNGVAFFLLERTPDQADCEAESYTPAIWDQDKDLLAMRHHVTPDFLETYHRGVKQYRAGHWTEAYKSFEAADDIMIRTVVDEGYLEIESDDEPFENFEARILNKADQGEDVLKIRHEFGDGACRTLMNYIERRNFEAPEDWDGVRQLFSK